MSVVTLASRKALCLNEAVNQLTSSMINEKCTDLRNQKPSKKTKSESEDSEKDGKEKRRLRTQRGGGCPFLQKRKPSDLKRHEDVVSTLLSKPMDLEASVRYQTNPKFFRILEYWEKLKPYVLITLQEKPSKKPTSFSFRIQVFFLKT